MALTKKQIVKKFLPNVVNKQMQKLTWQNVENALFTLSNTEKERIANKLSKRDLVGVGRILYKTVLTEVQIDSEMSVSDMIADNKLNLSELEQLLSDD
jgi:hypothetical protein